MIQIRSFRVSAFIRTHDESLDEPNPQGGERISDQTSLILTQLFEICRLKAKSSMRKKFEYLGSVKVMFFPGKVVKIVATTNVEGSFIKFNLAEDEIENCLINILRNWEGFAKDTLQENFKQITHLRIFLIDDDNIAINFT